MQNADRLLTGKTALVTGAAKRLGRAISLALADRGVRLLVHYNRSSREALALCTEIEQAGGTAWPVRGDLSDADQVEAVFREAVAKAGEINILINNASIFERDTLWEATDQSIWRNLHIHALAPLILGVVLGPIAEKNLRQAMIISGNDPMVLVSSPLSATLIVVSALSLFSPQLRTLWARRKVANGKS